MVKIQRANNNNDLLLNFGYPLWIKISYLIILPIIYIPLVLISWGFIREFNWVQIISSIFLSILLYIPFEFLQQKIFRKIIIYPNGMFYQSGGFWGKFIEHSIFFSWEEYVFRMRYFDFIHKHSGNIIYIGIDIIDKDHKVHLNISRGVKFNQLAEAIQERGAYVIFLGTNTKWD